jgi:hypothetical protein
LWNISGERLAFSRNNVRAGIDRPPVATALPFATSLMTQLVPFAGHFNSPQL